MASELILVVDDGASNRKLYERLLSREGYLVDTAIGAEEALTKLQTVRPHLVLIDVHLGGMNGLELTRQIRADPSLRSIAIIAMTAHHDEYNERLAHEAGADAFIILPIDITTFVPTIRSVLGAGHNFQASTQERIGPGTL